MIHNLDKERLLEELQEEDYGNHPTDIVENTLEEGASGEYEDTGELLTDISTAAQKINAQDTRNQATELLDEYCSELCLKDEASAFGGRILDYLDDETISNHKAEAVAGASTYLSSLFVNEKVTKKEVEKVGKIRKGRFKNAYKDIKNQITEDGASLVSDFPTNNL